MSFSPKRDRSRRARLGMPIANAPVVTMLPEKLSRYAAVATLFLKYGKNVGDTTDDGRAG